MCAGATGAEMELASRESEEACGSLGGCEDDKAKCAPVAEEAVKASSEGGGASEAEATAYARACAFYASNSFVINVIIVICLAKAGPWVGAEYLAPRITASQVAVMIIFFFTGLGLKTRELVKALSNYRFNAFVQLFNLGAVPLGEVGSLITYLIFKDFQKFK